MTIDISKRSKKCYFSEANEVVTISSKGLPVLIAGWGIAMNMLIRRQRAYICLLISFSLAGCSILGGEQVGSNSGIVQTSILPTSVPYYLNLCGQDDDKQRYRLYSPSALGRWAAGKDDSGLADVKAAKSAREKREMCTRDRKIENGDPITVRLHRVGIGGLAKFSENGVCKSGCRRDIAIVLDFNGNQTLQRPIVAFYQRNVPPDGNLQFVNQTIFAQNEWFFRYPPSVRVRLYDVRDDKDRSLKANLETVSKGANFIRSYIAGAAVAGPIVDTALKAAEQLIDGSRNRPILDMSFQLFPQQPRGAEEAPPTDERGDVEKEARGRQQTLINSDPLTIAEISQLQDKLGVNATGAGVGRMGPLTQAAVRKSRPDVARLEAGTAESNKALRSIIFSQETAVDTPGATVPDPTFGSPIYASQFIVFNETAPGMEDCDSSRADKIKSLRNQLGKPLPSYYFVPDGVYAGGARVYAALESAGEPKDCLLETPFVIFSITRENVAVAADVAKRISDLQTKFAADATVSEDAIASLGSAYIDAELALAIDRVENTWRADQLAALLRRLEKQQADSKKLGEDDTAAKPLASAAYRYRAYKLVEEYTGCPAKDGNRTGYFTELAELLTPLARTSRKEGASVPYFKPLDGAKFTCPAPESAGDSEEESEVLKRDTTLGQSAL